MDLTMTMPLAQPMTSMAARNVNNASRYAALN